MMGGGKTYLASAVHRLLSFTNMQEHTAILLIIAGDVEITV